MDYKTYDMEQSDWEKIGKMNNEAWLDVVFMERRSKIVGID